MPYHHDNHDFLMIILKRQINPHLQIIKPLQQITPVKDDPPHPLMC